MKLLLMACITLFASLVFTGLAFIPDRHTKDTNDRAHICRFNHNQFVDTCGVEGTTIPK